MTKKHYFQAIIAIAVFSLGIILGSVWSGTEDSGTARKSGETFEKGSGYTLINPLLSCEDIPSLSEGSAKNIRKAVEEFLAQETAKGNLVHASVYFRDLNNGPWFGIHEKEEFTPASLLKLPLVMSVFHITETNLAFLQQQVEYVKGDAEIPQYFKPAEGAEVGKVYTIEKLLEFAIEYSDNTAAFLLADAIGDTELGKSYERLGIEVPKDGNYTIQTKAYASFFRILFNSSYLSHEYSQKALELLLQSRFTDGLVAGVPKGTKVAHKFGERYVSGGISQLHDCGIVYYPKIPYVLCAMTQGKDIAKLPPVIAGISKTVWEGVSKE